MINLKSQFQTVIRSVIEEVLEQSLVSEASRKKYMISNPIQTALIPDEIFKFSNFDKVTEHLFAGIWTKLAVVAANAGLGYGVAGHRIKGTIKEGRLRRILETVNRLGYSGPDDKRTKPDWNTELAYILRGRGQDIPVSVICDVYAEDRTNNKRYAFELKAPLPNSDQSKVSKEKIFKLYCMNPLQVDGAYYALPYNPYGLRENYRWSFPSRWFNMREDEVVLIGEEFWEKVGGPGTYKAFIDAVNEIGNTYKERVYREFLGIEPPLDSDETKL
jgi:Type II restriction endonuclease, TdeIII